MAKEFDTSLDDLFAPEPTKGAEASLDDLFAPEAAPKQTPLEQELAKTPGFFERKAKEETRNALPQTLTLDEIKNEGNDFLELARKQGMVDDALNELGGTIAKGVSFPLQAALYPLIAADRALSGAADRVTEVAGDVIEAAVDPTKDLSLDEVVNSFLNPRAIVKAREVAEKKAFDKWWNQNQGTLVSNSPGVELEDVKAQSYDLFKKENEGILNQVGRLYAEVVPQIDMSDVVLEDSDWDKIAKEYSKASTVRNKPILGPEGMRNFLKFSAAAGLSPLNFVNLFPRIAPKLGAATDDASQAFAKAMGEASTQPLAAGLATEAAEGTRALMNFKLPLMENPLFTIKGQSILSSFDNFKSIIDRPIFRSFTTRSGFEFETKAAIAREVEKGAQAAFIKEALPLVKSVAAGDAKVVQYVQNVRNLGLQAGEALSAKQGIKLTPDQIERANEIRKTMSTIEQMGNDVYFEATGINLAERAPKKLTPAEEAEALARIKEEYGVDLPRVVVDGQDITFSAPGYDGGRILRQEALDARREALKLKEASDRWRAETDSGGFQISPSAAKERMPISDVAMDLLYKKAYGVDDAVIRDPLQVVAVKALEKIEAAGNIKYYKTVRNQYGVTEDKIQGVINAAKNRVAALRAQGKPVPYEDLLLSRYTKNDFVRLDNRFFDKLDRIFSDPMKAGRGDLFYPKPVAERLRSLITAPTQSGALRAMEALQSQWQLNALTNAVRVMPQLFDNVIRSISAGVNPVNILKETINVFRPEGQKDWIAKLADSIPAISETLTDMTEFYGKRIKVNPISASSKEVQHGVDAYMRSLHGLQKTGKLEKIYKSLTLRNLAKAPWNAVRFANENPVSEFIRRFAGSPDVIAKRAYFRQLMEEGWTADQAMYQVGEKFMDFSTMTNTVRNARFFMPFASFMFKNMETTLHLALLKPGFTNIINPYDGHFKKAFFEGNGLDPDVMEVARKVFPFYRDEIPAMVLKGTEKLVSNPSWVNSFVRSLATFGMSDEDKKMTEAELDRQAWLFSLKLPTYLQASKDLLDVQDPMSKLSSPVILSMGVALTGFDWVTGRSVDGNSDIVAKENGIRNRLREAARLSNPLNYRRAMQTAYDFITERIPGIRESLQNGLVTKDLEHVFRLHLDKDEDLNAFRLNEREVMAMTNPRFFGLGRLDRMDFTFITQQLGLLNQAERLISGNRSLLVKEKIKKGDSEAARILNVARSTMADVKENIRIYSDLRARLGANYDMYSQDETVKGLGSIQIDVDESAPEVEAQPVEPELPQDEDAPSIDDLLGPEPDLDSLFDEEGAGLEPEAVNREPAQVIEIPDQGEAQIFQPESDAGVINPEEVGQIIQPGANSQVSVDSSGQVAVAVRSGAPGSRKRQEREATRDVDQSFIRQAEMDLKKKYGGKKLTPEQIRQESERLTNFYLELNKVRGNPTKLQNIRQGRPANEVAI